MNQLCVPIPTASDTHKILDEVFSLCRIPWIFDFIFRADPAADISMLLAPVQRRHALAARIFFYATETSSKYAHTFDFNKEYVFYSIPAFSVGPVTAGFCVEEIAAQTAKPSPDSGSQVLQCIRYVRDDTTGVFFHVCENQNSGVTEVDFLTHRSSTRQSRVRIKFDLRSLRSVLRTPRGILHPPDIAASLIYLLVSEERRSCPICHGRVAGECDCRLPLLQPAHSLDFRHEVNNMSTYTGFFQGATVVRLCNAGHCVINATLQSGSVFKGEMNTELIAKLRRLALKDRVSHLKARPKRAIASPSTSDLNVNGALSRLCSDAQDVVTALEKRAKSQADANVDEKFCRLGGFNREYSEGEDVAQVAAMEAAEEAEMETVEASPTKHKEPSDVNITSVGRLGDATGPTTWPTVSPVQPNSGSAALSEGQNIDISAIDSGPGISAQFRDLVENSLGDDALLDTDGLMDACELLGELDPGGLAELVSSNRGNMDGDQSVPVTVNPITTLESFSKQPTTIATDPDRGAPFLSGTEDLSVSGGPYDAVQAWEEEHGGNASTESAGGGEVESESGSREPALKRRRTRTDSREGKDTLTEEEKAEIRKKRNREAAARSNLKRKIRNESMRRELAKLTQQAVRLRVKETMLRDENTRLRNALRTAKIPFLPGR